MIDIAEMTLKEWRRAQESNSPALTRVDKAYLSEDPYGTGIGLWRKGLSYRMTLTPREKIDLHCALIFEGAVAIYVDVDISDQNLAPLIAEAVSGCIPGTAVFSAGEDRIVVADEENHELVFASVELEEVRDFDYRANMPCSVLRFAWPKIAEIGGVARAVVVCTTQAV